MQWVKLYGMTSQASASLLDELTSGDAQKIWSASSAIVHLRDAQTLDDLAAHLDEIHAKTNGIALGGAFFPNRERLNFALKKLSFHKNNQGCLCHLYPDYVMYNPSNEAKEGNVQILETTYQQEKWVDFYTCQCSLCGTQFHVEEREYHYTWWGWKITSEKPAAPRKPLK